MKYIANRRLRRRPAGRDIAAPKKDNQQDQQFFGETMHEPFFKPVAVMPQAAGIQRKCADCEKEEKTVQRVADKKEDEKKLMKKEDKKEEEKLHRMPEKKEEEKKLQKKEDKKDEEKLHRKEAATSSATNPSNYISTISTGGDNLPAKDNHFFSTKMGYDFSNVKIHTDKAAADSAEAVNAKAYTVGNHVVFNEGRYNSGAEGKKLMAHELTHVMQQDNKEIKNNLQRKTADIPELQQEEKLPFIRLEVQGSKIQNTVHHADCNGVSVGGNTQANYSSSAALATQPTRTTDCSGCTGANCVTVNTTVVSRFNTAPVVTLPAVPGGLNACERRAVRAFINGTLNQHEQQHVAAFNTYRGTVSTPISFTGCSADLQAEVQNIHDNIEVPRRQASDALSAVLDANGANIFNITCECPDQTP